GNAGAARSIVRNSVARSVDTLQAAYDARMTALTAGIDAAHKQIDTDLTTRSAEAAAAGERCKQSVQAKFRNHRGTIGTAVTTNVATANRMRDRYQGEARRRIGQQAAEARSRGHTQASSYHDGTDRGEVQADAARGVGE